MSSAKKSAAAVPPASLPPPRPVISWSGGKTRLIKHLLPLIPPHTAYVEVFGGGLALFCAKAPSRAEVINDINGDLVSFYRVIKYHLPALLAELGMVPNSRRDFEDYIAQIGLTEIQRAARWFLRNKLSFAGHGENFAIARTQALSSRARRLAAIRALNRRLDHTTIECRDWSVILDTYDTPDTFFFLDPPYFDDGGNYAGWTPGTLASLCARLQTLKGRWLLTYQDIPEVRALLPGCRFHAVSRQKGIANIDGATRGCRYKEVVVTPPAKKIEFS
ncbi:MAG: DNA adenine methylase [Opitutaceae bacterium]|jgi:DNA adenine methylase|nr:DNA adenine methylase [Opitutaceae bacterium]